LVNVCIDDQTGQLNWFCGGLNSAQNRIIGPAGKRYGDLGGNHQFRLVVYLVSGFEITHGTRVGAQNLQTSIRFRPRLARALERFERLLQIRELERYVVISPETQAERVSPKNQAVMLCAELLRAGDISYKLSECFGPCHVGN